MPTPMKMATASTIRDYSKSYNSETITFDEYFLKQVLVFKDGSKALVNFDSCLVKYMPEIKQIVTKVEFPNDKYLYYRFNPKLLSYDLYGTTELWALILDINELKSAAEFDIRTVKLPNMVILDRLTRIGNLEQMSKDYNAEETAAALLD